MTGVYDDAELGIGFDYQLPRALEHAECEGQSDQWPEGDGIEAVVQ